MSNGEAEIEGIGPCGDHLRRKVLEGNAKLVLRRPPYQDDFAVTASAEACSASRIGVLPFRVPGTVPPAAVLPGFRLR